MGKQKLVPKANNGKPPYKKNALDAAYETGINKIRDFFGITGVQKLGDMSMGKIEDGTSAGAPGFTQRTQNALANTHRTPRYGKDNPINPPAQFSESFYKDNLTDDVDDGLGGATDDDFAHIGKEAEFHQNQQRLDQNNQDNAVLQQVQGEGMTYNTPDKFVKPTLVPKKVATTPVIQQSTQTGNNPQQEVGFNNLGSNLMNTAANVGAEMLKLRAMQKARGNIRHSNPGRRFTPALMQQMEGVSHDTRLAQRKQAQQQGNKFLAMANQTSDPQLKAKYMRLADQAQQQSLAQSDAQNASQIQQARNANLAARVQHENQVGQVMNEEARAWEESNERLARKEMDAENTYQKGISQMVANVMDRVNAVNAEKTQFDYAMAGKEAAARNQIDQLQAEKLNNDYNIHMYNRPTDPDALVEWTKTGNQLKKERDKALLALENSFGTDNQKLRLAQRNISRGKIV